MFWLRANGAENVSSFSQQLKLSIYLTKSRSLSDDLGGVPRTLFIDLVLLTMFSGVSYILNGRFGGKKLNGSSASSPSYLRSSVTLRLGLDPFLSNGTQSCSSSLSTVMLLIPRALGPLWQMRARLGSTAWL